MFQHLIFKDHIYRGPNPNSLPRKVISIGTKRELDIEGIETGPMVAYSQLVAYPSEAFKAPRFGASVRYEELKVFARWCKQDVTQGLQVVVKL